MFIPGFLIFFTFQYVPMYGLLIAFKDFKALEGIWNSPWAGLDHFRRLFAGDDFSQVLRNTVYIAILKVVFVFPAPIVLAILLNEVRNRLFRKWVQTVSYLPYFFSWVILAGILFSLLSMEGGVNQMLAWFGIPQIAWFMNPDNFYGIVIVSAVWQGVGWGSIIYFAALSAIDPTLYEAAIADGANRFKQIWHITLPSLLPTIITMFLLYIGHFLSVGFDQIYNLTTPINSNVADILDTYVLRRMLTMDYELGTVAGIFSSLVGLMLVVGSNWLIKKYDKDQGLW